MCSLYNEYLTGADREAAIIVAESEAQYAKLNIFYDMPTWDGKNWNYSRKICEIDSYMFPEIGCGECFEFNSTKPQ